MQKRFNYLQHEGAVREILKHKWIESQKLGRDIGFVTAAHDWITKYGESWQKIHNQQAPQKDSQLIERRKYRRFKINIPITIRTDNLEFESRATALNHIGIDFLSDISLVTGSLIEIVIPFKINSFDAPTNKAKGSLRVNTEHCRSIKEQNTEMDIMLRAKVVKSILRAKPGEQKKRYLIFTEFEQNAQQKILDNQNWLFN